MGLHCLAKYLFRGLPNTKGENIFHFVRWAHLLLDFILPKLAICYHQMMISLKSGWGLLQMNIPTLIMHKHTHC